MRVALTVIACGACAGLPNKYGPAELSIGGSSIAMSSMFQLSQIDTDGDWIFSFGGVAPGTKCGVDAMSDVAIFFHIVTGMGVGAAPAEVAFPVENIPVIDPAGVNQQPPYAVMTSSTGRWTSIASGMVTITAFSQDHDRLDGTLSAVAVTSADPQVPLAATFTAYRCYH